MCLSGAVGVFKEGVDGSFCIPPDMSGEQVENRGREQLKTKQLHVVSLLSFVLFGWLPVCLWTQIPSEYINLFPCSFSAMSDHFLQEAASRISDLFSPSLTAFS